MKIVGDTSLGLRSTGSLDCTYNYYLSGNSVVEEQNGSAQSIKDHVWGLTYIDEAIQTRINTNPTGTASWSSYWLMQDANYNVLGIVNSSGVLQERYEYTPYGQRQVFASAGSNDPGCYAPIPMSTRVVTSGSVTQPWGLCEIGHQGLIHDEQTGMIYNRARMLNTTVGRWNQEEPFGAAYVDGENLYQADDVNPLFYVDPFGGVAAPPTPAPPPSIVAPADPIPGIPPAGGYGTAPGIPGCPAPIGSAPSIPAPAPTVPTIPGEPVYSIPEAPSLGSQIGTGLSTIGGVAIISRMARDAIDQAGQMSYDIDETYGNIDAMENARASHYVKWLARQSRAKATDCRDPKPPCDNDDNDEANHYKPKYLIGPNGDTIDLPMPEHRGGKGSFHDDLYKHMGRYGMAPSNGNSGQDIRDKYSLARRLKALADFYNGPCGKKWKKEADAFFRDYPPLKK